MKSRLQLAMAAILQQQQGGIEKNLFRLSHGYTMLVILPSIAVVPVEPNNFVEINHFLYITIMYIKTSAAIRLKQPYAAEGQP